MKNNFKLLIVLGLISFNIHSQGCSDAGFCNLQNAKEVDNFLTKQHAITFGAGYGLGLETISVAGTYLEYGYSANNNLSFSSRLTYQNTTGSFGSYGALGDVFLTANYKITNINDVDFRLLLGGKIPLNAANATNDASQALPMIYQSSLGTYDLIIGTSMLFSEKWDVSIAFQIPIINKNENQFSGNFVTLANNPLQSVGFNRKSDGLLKIGYIYDIPESRITLIPNLLSVFHLGKDSFVDSSNNQISINDSQGVTINCVLNAVWTLKDDSQFVVALATPSPIRTASRPDGLIRVFGLNMQYRIKF